MKKSYVFLMMVIGMLLCSVVPVVALTPDMVIDRAARCLGKERKDIRNLGEKDYIYNEENPLEVEALKLNFSRNKVSDVSYIIMAKNRSSISLELNGWMRWLELKPEWKIVDDKSNSKFVEYTNGKVIVRVMREEFYNDGFWALGCQISD